MLRDILHAMTPYIAEMIFAAVSTYGTILFRSIFKTKQSQQSLHSALHTGVYLLSDVLADQLTRPELIKVVIDYVRRSTPDAVGYLKPSQEQLEDMAESKLNQRDHKDKVATAVPESVLLKVETE